MAGLVGYTPKSLRDTHASQLLTAGVSLGYIQEQLGHSEPQVTARRYARWVNGSEYRVPMKLQPGEVPADLLARIEAESPEKSPDLSVLKRRRRRAQGKTGA